jgi:hypothetical protein
MSAQDGNHLSPPAPAAVHISGLAENASTPASRQSPFVESRSDLTNFSPAPEALIPARSTQSGLTTAPASPLSESATPDDSEAAAAAPYGTRSRQRASGSRPNYAEDKDVDMDIEMNGMHSKAALARKSGTVSDQMEESWEGASRRGFSAINGVPKTATGNAQVLRESIPGTSTFAANPTPTTSKKRKQPGSSASTTTSTPHSIAARPKGSGGTNGRLQPETNMMSFDRCGGYLNANGQLKADDGTVISVNGEMPVLSLNQGFC